MNEPNKLINDVLCMAPWSHLHVNPEGSVYPCCLINETTSLLGNVNKITLKDAWNSAELKNIRQAMLANKKHKSCSICYNNELIGGLSFRSDFNEKYGNNLNLVYSTQPDGTVEKIEMRYIDIRFSNLCNLKCRMCSPVFSSKIAAESGCKPAIKRIPSNMLEEVYNYLEICEEIYFAGGEPLIIDEHYLILEKLIELGVKPRIRYNSNITKLKHKHWDILELWNKFDDIYIQASIDGYKDEITYIRHPAKYENVINTALKYNTVSSVRLDITTCVGFWNIYSLPELHIDLLNRGVINHYTQFFMSWMVHPNWFTTKVLPQDIKKIVTEKLQNHIEKFILQQEKLSPTNTNYKKIWDNQIIYMNSDDHYKKWISHGIFDISQKDMLRKESFTNTFPLLAKMMVT